MKLNTENFDHKVLSFRDREAGVSVIFDPDSKQFTYNAYCLELKLMRELYSCEFYFLEDALNHIEEEFGSWELKELTKKSGCGSCVAKKH